MGAGAGRIFAGYISQMVPVNNLPTHQCPLPLLQFYSTQSVAPDEWLIAFVAFILLGRYGISKNN